MFDREFRRGLEDCLSRLSSGEDVRSCLESYPRYADRLEPYLEAASKLRGMDVPQPSAAAQKAGRQRLTAAMAGATPATAGFGTVWPSTPLMRLGTVAATLVLFLVVAIGGAAAFGGGGVVHDVFNALHLPSPVGGSGDDDGTEAVEFRGVAISVSQFGLALRTDDGIVSFQYTGETEFFDSQGEPINWSDITRGLDVVVQALPTDSSIFDAVEVRLDDGAASPTPSPEPTGSPEPEPTDKPEPEPTDKPEPEPTDKPEPEPTDKPEPEEPAATPAPSKVSFEGKIKSVASESFVLLSGETSRSFETTGETEISGFLAAGVFADVTGWKRHDDTFVAATVTVYPLDFWATVVSVSGSTVTVKIQGEGPNVTLHKTGETELIGPIFAGVKVWVKAFKKADGSYEAVRIAVKTTSFSGAVSAIEGSTYTVTKEGTTYTVTTNGETEFIGTPSVGSVVTVYAYKMADGSYLAYKIKVTEDVFTGVITDKNLDLNTIWVNVGGDVIEVRIDFADVIGMLEVGATVEVHVGWIEGSTYFAQLVKVIG